MTNRWIAVARFIPPLSWIGVAVVSAYAGFRFGWHASSGDAVVGDLCAAATSYSSVCWIQAIDHPDLPAKPWLILTPACFFVISVVSLPAWMADIAATMHYDGWPTIEDPVEALGIISRFAIGEGLGSLVLLVVIVSMLRAFFTGNILRFVKSLTITFGLCILLSMVRTILLI